MEWVLYVCAIIMWWAGWPTDEVMLSDLALGMLGSATFVVGMVAGGRLD